MDTNVTAPDQQLDGLSAVNGQWHTRLLLYTIEFGQPRALGLSS